MQRTSRALAVLALALTLVLAACGDEPRADDPNPVGTSSSATSEPTEDPTETGSPSSSASPDMVTVPVYFVAPTPIGPRLFREFRQVESANPLEEAVALMTAGDALDPDYETAYPGGDFASVEFDGTSFKVVVGDDSWNTPGPGMTPRDVRLAIQQLVYTIQGVEQKRAPVYVHIKSSSPPGLLFGVDTSNGLKAAKQLDVLGFVNVTTPEEGSTVADTFTASGVASSFEATVPWEIRDESGAKVAEGFATAEGWTGKLFPWETEVDVSGLAPGTYTFVAMTDDPSDGEGAGPTEDTKTIIIE